MSKYFKNRILDYCFWGITGIIVLVIFFLYNLPMETAGYLLAFFACVLSVRECVKALRYSRRLQAVEEVAFEKEVSCEGFPEAAGAIEKLYQEMYCTVFYERMELASKQDSQISSMIDYYTIWMHQIKTPIAAMHLLLQNEETANAKELEQELFRIESYVEMVLQYLRMNSETTDYHFASYSLGDIVKTAVKKYAGSFIRKKIHMDYKEIRQNVLTDEKWLTFVIEQLISNSLKYTKNGTVSIWAEQENDLLYLNIRDTGTGIIPEDLPRIFEKGYTGYNGRKDQKSTGIGLFLCKQILNQLSHTISIRSEIDKGTTVTLGFTLKNRLME